MFDCRNKRFFALTTLVVWLGAFYHDIWFSAAAMGHEHEHHAHQHQHAHDHPEDRDSEESTSIPLPDTHSVPFLLNKSTVSLVSLAQESNPELPTFWLQQIHPKVTNQPHAPPGLGLLREPRSSNLQRLAKCIQPNAPPLFA